MCHVRMALATVKVFTLAPQQVLLYKVQVVLYYPEHSKAHMVYKATLVLTAGVAAMRVLSSKKVISCYQYSLYTTAIRLMAALHYSSNCGSSDSSSSSGCGSSSSSVNMSSRSSGIAAQHYICLYVYSMMVCTV
jgi:uncharacterized membrane protein YgcG